MTKALTGQGGKGSVRRNEDTQKVLDGLSRIFGESKLDKKLREEKEAMKDLYDDAAGEAEDYEERSDEWTCDCCGGPMYRQAHWNYGQCDDCGARQELINDDYC
jgi:rubrerythrin